MEKFKLRETVHTIYLNELDECDINPDENLWNIFIGNLDKNKYFNYHLDFSSENREITVYGDRYETDEEFVTREMLEKKYHEEIMRKEEERKFNAERFEREMYERLKKKYEGII